MTGPDLGSNVIALGDVGSTNDEALARLKGDGPLWVTAQRQLAGRGRRGRPWTSEAGNLYASVAFRTMLSGDAFAALPLAAALSLGEALERLGFQPQLKWPNDLLIGGKKVSGILLESQSSGARRTMVMGFGVNIAHHPDDVPSTRLLDHGIATPERVLAELSERLSHHIDALHSATGVVALRDAWLSRAVGLKTLITVRLPTETIDGTFQGLDGAGRLLLDTGGTVHTIAAGDVFIHRETP